MNDIYLGTQYLVEFYECSNDVIGCKESVREGMLEAAKIAGATIVADVFHEFNPHGISGVVVIAESHIAIHSWPEYFCASLDIFTCSAQMNPEAAIEYLNNFFRAKKMDVKKVHRGSVHPPKF
jgi:S-adenosylmethionine decarboxylase proenzyme